MEPAFYRGDIVAIQKADLLGIQEFNPKDVQVGDIVVYNAKWFNQPVIHRIIDSKEINGTTWRVMSNDDLGVKSYFYYVVHNDALYLIELNGVDKFKDNMLDFINTLSFK